MEPKNLSFSAGAALILLYYLAPDAAASLGATTSAETITVTGLFWSALTAVIAPFAAVGKVWLERLADMWKGPAA